MNETVKLAIVVVVSFPFVSSSALGSCHDRFTRPVRLIVGGPAGGGADIVARLIAQKLGERLGQQVVVDNRAGGAGNVATDLVSAAAPDGYTLLLATSSALAINPSLYKLRTDPIRDLTYIALLGEGISLLVVHNSLQSRSAKELISLAKTKQLNAGSGGSGSLSHLALELFNISAGTQIVHVPYKGTAPAIADLVGGQMQVMFAQVLSGMQMAKAGKLRSLAVTSQKRFELSPDIPTVSESALPGFEAVAWYGLAGPATFPACPVKVFYSIVSSEMGTQEFRRRYLELGIVPTPGAPEDFASRLRSDTAKWAKVIKTSGVKAD